MVVKMRSKDITLTTMGLQKRISAKMIHWTTAQYQTSKANMMQ